MKKYTSPFVLLAGGGINLTDSQLGELFNDPALAGDWTTFWAEYGELISEVNPDFRIGDESTWPAGFSREDPDTWGLLIPW